MSSPDAATCKARGGACLQRNILLLFQSSPSASSLGSGSCWVGSGRCWDTRLDSHCYFADFKFQKAISLSPLCHPFNNIGPEQVGAFVSQKARQIVLERSITQGGCSRGRDWVHTLPLKLIEAGWSPSWQESRSMGTKVWKHCLAKVRRRPRPADNYAKGCVCTGSSK